MNKADKIRLEAPGLAEGDVCALASLGTTEVDIIARALRQARRDAVAHEKELKRQRKIDNRAHSNYDEADYVRRNKAVVASQGKRAMRGSLAALAALGNLRRHIDTWTAWGSTGAALRATQTPTSATRSESPGNRSGSDSGARKTLHERRP